MKNILDREARQEKIEALVDVIFQHCEKDGFTVSEIEVFIHDAEYYLQKGLAKCNNTTMFVYPTSVVQEDM